MLLFLLFYFKTYSKTDLDIYIYKYMYNLMLTELAQYLPFLIIYIFAQAKLERVKYNPEQDKRILMRKIVPMF